MRILWLSFLLLAACSTTPAKREIQSETCGTTPIQANDMIKFGVSPVAGKINVVRFFATWCPYCKADLKAMGEKFRKGEWTVDRVKILLIAYKNRRENQSTLDVFVKKDFAAYGIPNSAVQMVYADKTYDELMFMNSASGDRILEGWQGVPFGLVFGKDGRLAFRGHFTQSPSTENDHYLFITRLLGESCAATGTP